uniref:Histone deacetylase domain-containing protein n=1 Tax=Aegilops tauschii subsp. strangulata TaxID=200361 RepID=A0A453B5N5_AEGTS
VVLYCYCMAMESDLLCMSCSNHACYCYSLVLNIFSLFLVAMGDPLGGCCITPDGYALLLTKLLGFAKGRIVMALEGGYNLKSIANSLCACTKVLLGDNFTYNSPRMQPFESTWRVIQMVRDELKAYWPVLSSKLPDNVPLRSAPSYIEVLNEVPNLAQFLR